MEQSKKAASNKLAIKGEVNEMQLMLKKEVEKAPMMPDGQSLQITFD